MRYELAYLCVLRTGAAVLARRARPGSLPTRPHPIWGLLASTAPELAEWAQFFTVCGTHNAALVKGGARVSARQADDLIRDAATFLAIVRSMVSSTSPPPIGAEMADFIHLHAASSYSMRYGADPPGRLASAAAAAGQPALALTDRDGVYGAVRFVRACAGAGVAAILGVDLAIEPLIARPGPIACRPASGAGHRPAAGPGWSRRCRGWCCWPAGRPGGRRCAG